MPKETYVPCLLNLFQQYGYDGATLSKISEATGLGKASLYHHFPGGKDEMVTTVLDTLQIGLEQHILVSLQGEGDAALRLQQMCDRISAFYEDGNRPCVLAILLLGSAREVFQARVQKLLRLWIDAIATVLVESGFDKQLAQQRAEDALVAIQGALVLAQGLSDITLFQRTLQQLPEQLCRP